MGAREWDVFVVRGRDGEKEREAEREEREEADAGEALPGDDGVHGLEERRISAAFGAFLPREPLFARGALTPC